VDDLTQRAAGTELARGRSSWTSNRCSATISRRWRVASRPLGLMSDSETLGGDFRGALADITVPSYVIDKAGIVRWVNPAAMELVGDVRGLHFTEVVAPEDTHRARELFTRKIVGAVPATESEGMLFKADRTKMALEISAVPLKNGDRIVGVFGQFVSELKEPSGTPQPDLTPRQSEVLRLLEQGRSTQQIAEELHLTTTTVRNHVRNLLRALGVHSRIEAVAAGRRDAARRVGTD
jgi:PAS domain S-box-containing protein